MRRLQQMTGALLLFESAMYTAITPLLPHYAQTLHVSKAAVGLLAAGYSAGLIPGALLGGRLATRHGVRRTTLVGLVGFGLSVAGFGVATELVALDLLRVVQGVFCGLIWGGALTWVIGAAPLHRRGAVIGGVVGAATFGTLFGPLLGTVAIALGTGPVFGATGAVSLGLAVWASRHDESPARPPAGAIVGQLRDTLRAGGFALGAWLMVLAAVFFAAAGVLLPLRLARFGAPGWEIGATFVVASALSTVLSPVVGRAVDRRGPLRATGAGLVIGAPLLAALVLPTTAPGLAALSVVALSVPMTAAIISAVSLMTNATERAGVTLVLATTAINLAYAVGETIGAPAAASISQATGDGVPLLAVAALMLATVPFLRGARASARAPGRHGPREPGGGPRTPERVATPAPR